MPHRIPLIVAFTPSYLIPAATTLLSILQTSSASYEVVCLLSEPLDDQDRRRLEAIDGGSGRLAFRYFELSDELEGAFVDPKYTAAANFRLVIADKLPEWDKAIYLDCDIIVRQDLGRLYETIDLEGYYLAGIAETSTDYQIKRMQDLGCEAGKYINSGFLVMNLDLLRRDHMGKKLVAFLQAPYLEFPDQDALNVVCRDRILYLSPLYNGIRTFMLPAYRETFLRYHDLELWHQIRREATIHYTGEKPWRAYTFLFEKWWQCYHQLPEAVRTGYSPCKKTERLALLFSIPGIRPIANTLLTLRRKWSKH